MKWEREGSGRRGRPTQYQIERAKKEEMGEGGKWEKGKAYTISMDDDHEGRVCEDKTSIWKRFLILKSEFDFENEQEAFENDIKYNSS